MIFRQLFDPQASTYTYLLADSATREALLIDPVFDHALRDAALIEELGVKLLYTLETHVHADHVTGAWLLKRRLGSRIALSQGSGGHGGDRALGEGDFVGYMTHLGLPHPKLMEVAVPANLRCGRPENEALPAAGPDWAPLSYTFAGIWELQPDWLAENAGRVQVLDVREPEEYTG